MFSLSGSRQHIAHAKNCLEMITNVTIWISGTKIHLCQLNETNVLSANHSTKHVLNTVDSRYLELGYSKSAKLEASILINNTF